MNAKELSEYLAARAGDVCQWLLPNGKKQGREWKVGSVQGEEGQSLAVCLAGEKRGIWADFSNGESGDMLDLICAVRGVNLSGAMQEASKQFGIPLETRFKTPAKSYKKPDKPKTLTKATNAIHAFLEGRGITKETGDRFRIAEMNQSGKTYIVMPYVRDGETINIKYRNIADKKDMQQSAGCEPCLFGWHLIDPNCRAVVITEGEFDAMILSQCGVSALSVNQGAGAHQWIESDYQRLERFSDIFLWFDNDEVGQKHVREVGRRLGDARVKYVVSKQKDANDTFLSGGADEVLEELANAKTYDPEELRDPKDFTNDLIEEFHPNDERASGVCLYMGYPMDYLRFRPGEVTTWTGENGHGKSVFVGYQSIYWMDTGHKTVVFSGEMAPAKLLRRYAQQLSRNRLPDEKKIREVMDWLSGKLYIFDHFGYAGIDRLLEVFEYASKRYGATQFVIDSLMTTDVPEDGNGFMEKQRIAMSKLMGFAKRTNSHVHLIAHPRKLQDGKPPTKNDIAGSGKIAAMSHNVVAVFADFKHEYGDKDKDGYCFLYKQRTGDAQYRQEGYEYEVDSMQFLGRDITEGFEWI